MSMKFPVAAMCWWFAMGCVVEPPLRMDLDNTAPLSGFDDADWAHVLSTYVDDQGRVNYPALVTNRQPLDRFVSLIGHTGPTTQPAWFLSRDDQLAYYLNAYNALTLFNVINRWPIDSVITDKVSFFVLTLYNLENGLVRPTFQDPRVHFALNCASTGCPHLPQQPFRGLALQAQLQQEAIKFVHQTRNVEVVGNAVVLSNIFDWYKEDFGDDPVTYIRSLAPDLNLPAGDRYEVRSYDWSVNAQPK
jgi:hypothetical protein